MPNHASGQGWSSLAEDLACGHPRPAGLAARRIADEDLVFLSLLYAATRAEELASTGWSGEAQQQFLDQQFQFQHRYYQAHYADADFLLLQREGQPLGRLYWHTRGSQATLIDISLLPAQRGQGLGSALLQMLTARADALQQAIDLHVEPANPAHRLYERFGFAAIATNGVYLKMRRLPGQRGPQGTSS
jgi:ribosomal protein S18 acetylase RimI-like enzyme